jgi:protein-tyrosine phosphatase
MDAWGPADRIEIEGTFNVRDVGTLPVAGGGCVQSGLLYRGDSIDDITDAGERSARDLNLQTIIDLREPAERGNREPPMGVGARCLQIPIFRGRFNFRQYDGLAPLYAAVIARAGHEIAEAIAPLAEPRALPALVHCTAGKDRTGLVVGLLLSALGVPDAEVAANYALTERYFGAELQQRAFQRAAEAGLPAQQLAVMAGSPSELMVRTLEDVRRHYRSAGEYLRDHGVTSTALASLKRALVDVTANDGGG